MSLFHASRLRWHLLGKASAQHNKVLLELTRCAACEHLHRIRQDEVPLLVKAGQLAHQHPPILHHHLHASTNAKTSGEQSIMMQFACTV